MGRAKLSRANRADREAKLADIELACGQHETRDDGMCAMEAVAFITGNRHSDWPSCVCPVVTGVMQWMNDVLPNQLRQELLKPLILRVVGTVAEPSVMAARLLCWGDWAWRVLLPIWLDESKLTDWAKQFRTRPATQSRSALAVMTDNWVGCIQREIRRATPDAATGWDEDLSTHVETIAKTCDLGLGEVGRYGLLVEAPETRIPPQLNSYAVTANEAVGEAARLVRDAATAVLTIAANAAIRQRTDAHVAVTAAAGRVNEKVFQTFPALIDRMLAAPA